MSEMKRFKNQPGHRNLIFRAVEVLSRNNKVKGLYLSGSVNTDDYSDIDLTILSTNTDRQKLENKCLEIAQQIGEIKAEAFALLPHTYVVIYEPDDIKLDFNFHAFPLESRPDKTLIDILYDPEGHGVKLIDASVKLDWSIDMQKLENRVKHFFVTLNYTMNKIERGEYWEARDCVEWYRQTLITLEHILDKRQQLGYRRIENIVVIPKYNLLMETIPPDLTVAATFRALDKILEYFDIFLKDRFISLNIFPAEYAGRMLTYYERKKSLLLQKT